MIKKLPFFVLVLFLLQIKFLYSQSNKTSTLIDNFEITMNETGLSKPQILQIKDLLIKKDQLLTENIELEKELNAKYPFVFHDQETTTKYINQQFVHSLSEIVTISQFKQLFLSQLNYRIKTIAEDKFNLSKKRYKFTVDQEAKLKKLLQETTTNEIIIKEYYSYDDNLSWNNYTEEKIKSSDKERELLKSFGLFYSKNTKTDNLIKKLIEAQVDAERINQILLALQILQERNDKRLKTWRENDVANAFNFHDPGDDEYAIYLDFREQLSKILKIEEFKTVFVSQMQNRIVRDTQKEFQILKSAYKLTDAQYDEIQKLVLEKNTEKIVTEEYYKYSYELYQQKLRAVEYRHEKNIRETIQKMMNVTMEIKK
ncbi:hypothetical protein C8C83_0570 [Flavobacterium sp. 90]|uniref:hypothetical protein n=1 Tax=unclassified Flavobacterium TaxID=196869 RepID=UPI000EB1574C|nr:MULTISPECIES: hypothetical protein [unclassified Flavobacterium]RKR08972.1 hypothetical protein C8C82_0865 [Flavobacterium sp. 81]TCK52760.1 hypothetical protein C8C83_0570 [Flavobacterium sp. 90]